MAIKIGHASADENRKSHGGAAGDQTKGEVCTRSWYSSPWNLVLRPKDSAKAEKMAKACEAACANDKIGYDQYQRNTLLPQAKACGWDLSKITTACETDCSALMTVCAQCAGIDVPYISGNAPYTGIMKAQFMKTGEFEALTDKEYLNSDAYLKRGDILVRTSGHTAMALENGSKAGEKTGSNKNTSTVNKNTSTAKLEAAYKFDKAYAKTYTVTASSLNMRSGSDINKTILKVLKKGDKVTCYGYYNKKLSTVWLLVKAKDGTTGYCSKQWLN